jgi:competence protein ComEC
MPTDSPIAEEASSVVWPGATAVNAGHAAPSADRLFWLLTASIAGAGVQLLQPQLWAASVYARFIAPAFMLSALSAFYSIANLIGGKALDAAAAPASGRRKRRRATPIPVVVLVVAAATFGATGWRAAHYAAQALQPALEGQDLEIVGTIAAMPQRNPQGLRLRVAVQSATQDGRAVDVPPLVDLGWWNPQHEGTYAASKQATKTEARETSDTLPDVRAGDRWRFTARLKAPHGARNPFGFDYELWAWERGVQATGSIRAGKKSKLPELLDHGWAHPVERARQAVRDAILLQLSPTRLADPASDSEASPHDSVIGIDPGAALRSDAARSDASRQRAAGVVAALVTGDQRAIDRADWDIFRATGTAHLISISGLHIGMLAWLAALLIGWAWRRSAWLCDRVPAPHAALIGGIACAAAYGIFSGGGLPAQRTLLMLVTVGGLRISGRRWPWPLVWLLACAAVVALDPWALLQAGFWLSFVAVGVLFAGGLGTTAEIAGTARLGFVLGKFHPRLMKAFRAQAMVTLALTPLTLLLFGQASVVGFIANLIAIPWMTLIVTPMALLGVLMHPLWSAAAWAVEMLAALLQWFAALPHAVVTLPTAPAWAAIAALLGGVLLCMRLPWSLRLMGVAPLLPVLLWQQPRPAQGEFDLLAADIGQGEAVLVRTAHHALLYDTGPKYSADDDAGHRVLVPLLQALGEPLDTVMVSHRDSDHAGGAAAVLTAQPQANFRSSIEATNPLQRLRKVERCIAGQSWTWDGVRFSILHPQTADYTPTARSNTLSCVLRVESANHHIAALLTGDIEAEQEAALVSANAPLAANVLVAPHHGSRHSSTAGFLHAVAPRLVIVQAGYGNRYGHPAPETLARYTVQGSAVVASPACGAARWHSDRPAVITCERVTHRHYWQHAIEPPQAALGLVTSP